MPFINKNGRRIFVDGAEFDDSPLYAVEVNTDGTLDHSVAYDPMYEKRCECGAVVALAEEHCA